MSDRMTVLGRWKPPSKDRVPINIHPDARERLRNALMDDPRLHGVGYSEFIMRALDNLGAVEDRDRLLRQAALVLRSNLLRTPCEDMAQRIDAFFAAPSGGSRS